MAPYKIKRITDNIFLIVVPDDYERSMLFLRVQEYSESPNRKFRGKSFDLMDFIKWYTLQNKDKCFSYGDDWVGFNTSYLNAVQCYKKLPFKYVTKYDFIMLDILREISHKIGSSNLSSKNVYMIGTGSADPKNVTTQHEIFHAYYFTSSLYRKKVKEAIHNCIPKHIYDRLRSNLVQMGYLNQNYTIHNEMQAYLRGKDWNHPGLSTKISKGTLNQIHKCFSNHLEKYFED